LAAITIAVSALATIAVATAAVTTAAAATAIAAGSTIATAVTAAAVTTAAATISAVASGITATGTTTAAVSATSSAAATATAAATASRQYHVTLKQRILDIGDRRCMMPVAVGRQQIRRDRAPGRKGHEQDSGHTHHFFQHFSFHIIPLYPFWLTIKSGALRPAGKCC
jgi:ABC-type multidrug transport system fused ATPase/permease subunit